MSEAEIECYWLHITRLRAKRKRQALELRPDLKITVEGMYQLVLDETGDTARAEVAAAEYMAQQLRNEESVS